MTTNAAADLFRAEPLDYIPVSTGEVAYRRTGSGPDVLFVHGWPVHSATFRCLLPYLADRFTCHLIDLPGAGSSRFSDEVPVSLAGHIAAVRSVLDWLDSDSVAVVGHDSGGLVARHAVTGDKRIRAMGLIDTEQPQGMAWRFRSFLIASKLPAFGPIFGRVAGNRFARRNGLAFGNIFADRSFLDGEFDEFFLHPLSRDDRLLRGATALIRSFDTDYVFQLAELHPLIDVPTVLVWGAKDAFFPRDWAYEMAEQFPNAHLEIIADAGLFSHEERPAEVAEALRSVLGHELSE